jgi:hypothetical protein
MLARATTRRWRQRRDRFSPCFPFLNHQGQRPERVQRIRLLHNRFVILRPRLPAFANSAVAPVIPRRRSNGGNASQDQRTFIRKLRISIWIIRNCREVEDAYKATAIVPTMMPRLIHFHCRVSPFATAYTARGSSDRKNAGSIEVKKCSAEKSGTERNNFARDFQKPSRGGKCLRWLSSINSHSNVALGWL